MNRRKSKQQFNKGEERPPLNLTLKTCDTEFGWLLFWSQNSWGALHNRIRVNFLFVMVYTGTYNSLPVNCLGDSCMGQLHHYGNKQTFKLQTILDKLFKRWLFLVFFSSHPVQVSVCAVSCGNYEVTKNWQIGRRDRPCLTGPEPLGMTF